MYFELNLRKTRLKKGHELKSLVYHLLVIFIYLPYVFQRYYVSQVGSLVSIIELIELFSGRLFNYLPMKIILLILLLMNKLVMNPNAGWWDAPLALRNFSRSNKHDALSYIYQSAAAVQAEAAVLCYLR